MWRKFLTSLRRDIRLDLFFTLLLVLLLLVLIGQLPLGPVVQAAGNAKVMDGDSLRVSDVEVRLVGVDAPELHQTCTRQGKTWPCGHEAAAALRRRIAGQEVRCEGREKDRFGRLLARCAARDSELNRWIVQQGFAVSYDDYSIEEADARRAKRGLWSGEFEQPRAWRDRHAGS